jgi:hypothetical protein
MRGGQDRGNSLIIYEQKSNRERKQSHGMTELEVDYSHQHDWRCLARTLIEALLLASMFLVIFLFCAALQ